MMVVIAIIAILAGLIVGLAGRVTKGGKYTASRHVITSLETVLTEFTARAEAPAPSWVRTTQTQAVLRP